MKQRGGEYLNASWSFLSLYLPSRGTMTHLVHEWHVSVTSRLFLFCVSLSKGMMISGLWGLGLGLILAVLKAEFRQALKNWAVSSASAIFLLFNWNRVLLSYPVCPWPYSVTESGLELTVFLPQFPNSSHYSPAPPTMQNFLSYLDTGRYVCFQDWCNILQTSNLKKQEGVFSKL